MLIANRAAHRNQSVFCSSLNMISADGACRFLDADGAGYVKSEAAVCIVLQRADLSWSLKRVRALIRSAEYNTDGYKKEGITYPSSSIQSSLIRRCFEKAQLDPHQVNYVEAHGTGTKAGDLEEMKAIDSVFNSTLCCGREESCKGRTEPLRVGSVKTNCGHAEAASGLLSIGKVLAAFQYRQIPPSIHFIKPNQAIESLVAGRIQPIVNQNLNLNTRFVSISSFGFGGANVHLILEDPNQNDRWHSLESQPNDNDCHESSECKLLLLSARSRDGTESVANQIVGHLKSSSLNALEIKFLNDFAINLQQVGFCNGGYLLYDRIKNEHEMHFSSDSSQLKTRNLITCCYANKSARSCSRFGNRRPIIFLIPGLGCQWNGMGASLAHIPLFIQQLTFYCSLIQPSLHFNLLDCLLGRPTVNQFNLCNSIYCLLGLAIFQMSFVDLLAKLGIRPDVFVGHSYGELICAWLDGLISPKQVLNSTLALCEQVCPGLSHLWNDENEDPIKLTKGAMAVLNCDVATGESMLKEAEIERVRVACDNSPACITISGDAHQIAKFLHQLEEQNSKVSGKMVASCKMAFHSDLVKEYYGTLKTRLQQEMGEPCARSSAWVSTSLPLVDFPEDADCFESEVLRKKQTNSIGSYFANCILSRVNFQQACSKISNDFIRHQEQFGAIKPLVIEIAPRKYIGSLAKSVLDCELLPTLAAPRTTFTDRTQELAFNHRPLLRLLGQLHEFNIPIQLGPLDRNLANTPLIESKLSLGSLVRWDHEINRLVRSYPTFFNPCPSGRQSSLSDVKNPFLTSHSLASSNVHLPISALLQLLVNGVHSVRHLDSTCKLEFVSLDWYKNQTCDLNSKFGISLLPVGDEQTQNGKCKFELHCNGHIFAVGLFSIYDDEPVSNCDTSESTFYSVDQFYNELEAQQNYESSSCKVLKEVSISETALTGKVMDGDTSWVIELEALFQLALKQSASKWNQVDCVHIERLCIHMNPDEFSSPDSSITFHKFLKVGRSTSILLQQIGFLQTDKIERQNGETVICQLTECMKLAMHLINCHAQLNFVESCLIVTQNASFAFSLLSSFRRSKPSASLTLVCTQKMTHETESELSSCFNAHFDQVKVLFVSRNLNSCSLIYPHSFDLVICDCDDSLLVQQSAEIVADHGQWICLPGKSSRLNQPLGLAHLLRNIVWTGVTHQALKSHVQECENKNHMSSEIEENLKYSLKM